MSSLLTREAVVDSRRQGVSLVGVGIVVWLLATATVWLAGGVLLPADAPDRVTFVFVATVPLAAMTAFAVYSLLDVAPERRLTAATLFVLPGMVLDAGVVVAFEGVFPTGTPEIDPTVGGLRLLWYATVLLTGVVPLHYVEEDSTDAASQTSTSTGDVTADRSEGETAEES